MELVMEVHLWKACGANSYWRMPPIGTVTMPWCLGYHLYREGGPTTQAVLWSRPRGAGADGGDGRSRAPGVPAGEPGCR